MNKFRLQKLVVMHFFYLFEDDHVLFCIFEYCNHEQIHKWACSCSSLRKFVKIHLLQHFDIDPSKTYQEEWERLCWEGNLKAIKYMAFKQMFCGPVRNAIRIPPSEIVQFIISYTLKTPNLLKNYLIPLFENASRYGNLEMVKYLFDFLQPHEFFVCMAVEESFKNEHWDIVKFLIEPEWTKYLFLIDKACRNGKMEIINYFISKGYLLNRDKVRNACLNGHLDIVKIFVTQGGDISSDFIMLENACKSKNLELIKYLVLHGNRIRQYLLSVVYLYSNATILKYLISQGLSIQGKVKNRLKTCCANNDLSIFTFFETRPLLFYSKKILKKYLFYACFYGNLNLVKYLISQGAKNPINKIQSNEIVNGTLPMWIEHTMNSAYDDMNSAYDEILKYLIDHYLQSEPLNPMNKLEKILKSAIHHHRFSLASYLISKGVKIELDNHTVYHLENKNLDIVKSILSQNADIDHHNGYLLVKACEKGDLTRVKFLIAQGAKMENRDAIHGAIKKGHLNIIKYLFHILSKCKTDHDSKDEAFFNQFKKEWEQSIHIWKNSNLRLDMIEFLNSYKFVF